jgi:zinc D-Ala-D-Ala carboxypeptidase
MQNYFSDDEFKCKCANCVDTKPIVIPALREALNEIRAAAGAPLRISANRCSAWNAAKKGSNDSRHLTGHAADVACTDSHLRYLIVKTALQSSAVRGVGVYNLHVHVDIFRFSDVSDKKYLWSGLSK